MLKVAIIGGSGYTGAELLRLLNTHPFVEITAVTSERSAGKPVTTLFPNLEPSPHQSRKSRLVFEPFKKQKVAQKADLFFLCLPHKESQEAVAFLHTSGKKVIDLSADYRLRNASVYKKWYQSRHDFPALLKKAVYGLPELHRDEIKHASIIANPGCYPASALLGLVPVMRSPAIDIHSIIIDSKSGVSGAGRNPSQPLMFAEANETVKAYAVTTHRHTPEIEQELSAFARKNIRVLFTPHLIPMDRGILSTIYVKLMKGMSVSQIHALYKNYYSREPFVRVLEKGSLPATKSVKGSNFCDISVFLEKRDRGSRTLIIVSAIDNLLKGASGQAVQNMNILYGFDETAGLTAIPAFP
jgi:N-acetyl-gamma-glutamyl-phosphate reductase